MRKVLFFLIILIFSNILFADGKVLLKAQNVTSNILRVRALVENLYELGTSFNDEKVVYMMINIGNKNVFNAALGAHGYKKQRIEFYTVDIPKENYITFKIIASDGHVFKTKSKIIRATGYSYPIIERTFLQEKNQIFSDVDILNSKTVSSAINLFSKGQKPIEIEENIYSPFCPDMLNKIPATNIYSVLFNISSEKKLDSIMILSSQGKSVVKAIINIPHTRQVFYDKRENIVLDGKIFISFPQIVFQRNEQVYILVRTKDKQVFKTKINTCELTPEDPEYLPVYIEL